MSNIIPFFEVNGQKYEIKRNRYLMAELDNMKSMIELTEEEESEKAKEQAKLDNLEKLSARKDELYEKYLETFDSEDEELYNKACAAYDKLIDEISKSENITGKQTKKTIDMAEKLLIRALQLDNKGNEIRTAEEANEIWCNYVDEVGKQTALQFVVFTVNYIIGGDDEEVENPFIKQSKAKAEQKAASKRAGMKRIK